MKIPYYLASATVYRLDYLIELCILGLVFFLPISLGMSTGFLLTGTLAWIAKMVLARRILFKRTSFDIVILAIVLIAAASIFMSPDKGFSFYNYYNLMGRYVLSYYLIVNHVHSFQQLKQVVTTIFVSAFVVVLYGFFQYIHGVDISTFEWVDHDEFPHLKMRVFSTLENPNLFAGYLNIIIALVLGIGLYSVKNVQQRIFLGLMLLGLGVCLGLTYCRGAWISIAAIIVTFGFFYSKKIFFVACLFVPLVFLFGHEVLLDRFASIIHPLEDSSSALRFALWDSTWLMIKDNPFLGIGWGAYWLVYPAYNYFIEDGATIYHAHNMYLNIAAEIGIPGFLFFLLFSIGHAKLAMTMFLTKKNRYVSGLMLGIFAAFIGLAVSGFTDYVLFNIQMSMLFWILNAIIVTMLQLCY